MTPRSAEVCPDELLDANTSPTKELAKAHALWPFFLAVRCRCVALRVGVAADVRCFGAVCVVVDVCLCVLVFMWLCVR